MRAHAVESEMIGLLIAGLMLGAVIAIAVVL